MARRRALLAAAPFAFVVLAVAAFDLRWHEPWRDEVGAMLEARAVPWGRLLEAMRCEGIPPLFHAMLKVLGAALPDPLALAAAGAIGFSTLLFGTYRLLLSISGARGASRLAAIAFSCTYVYAYELGVMVRQYTLGLGLALLSWSYLRTAVTTGDRRAVRAGALAAGLSALTSAHSACVAGAGLCAFGLVALARRPRVRGAWTVLITLPCFALVVWLASPYPERVADGNVAHTYAPAIAARLSLQALVEGVMPADWWVVESFVHAPLRDAFAALRVLAFWGVVAGAALALAARVVVVRARAIVFDLVAVVAGLPPLLVIVVGHYWGSYRHHLFLGTPLVVVLAGWGLDRRVAGRIAGEARRFGLALLAPWLLLQAALAAGSFALDLRYPFSDTKIAATMLDQGAHVLTDAEWRTIGMIFWRPDITMRSPSWRGRPFRYTRPDREWHRAVPLPPLVVAECQEAPERVYFAGYAPSLGAMARCARPIAYPRTPFADHPFTWESFELYRMDCACATAR